MQERISNDETPEETPLGATGTVLERDPEPAVEGATLSGATETVLERDPGIVLGLHPGTVLELYPSLAGGVELADNETARSSKLSFLPAKPTTTA